MSKRKILQCDLWGNVTYYNNNNKWVKQKFIDKNRISYEDSFGNLWNDNWETPFIFDNYISKCDLEPDINKLYLTEKRSSNKDNPNIYVTTTSLWMPSKDAVTAALRAPLILPRDEMSSHLQLLRQ